MSKRKKSVSPEVKAMRERTEECARREAQAKKKAHGFKPYYLRFNSAAEAEIKTAGNIVRRFDEDIKACGLAFGQ